MRHFLLAITLLISLPVIGQEDTIAGHYFLKTVEIVASDDFDAQVFIERVKKDTTFYKAFQNLRYFAHQSKGKLQVYNRKSEGKGVMKKAARHVRDGRYYWVDVTNEETNGRVKKKNGEYRYYTAELFDHAFFPADTLVASNEVDGLHRPESFNSNIDRHKYDIKLFMFNPGSSIGGVPIVGKKMAIFDDDMAPYYDYKIWQFDYQDSIPCYAFTCKAKPEFRNDKTVIKDLTSYFHRETMEIMMRDYHMMYKSGFFQFDVKIKVEMERKDGVLLPRFINYDGYWDVPTKRAEYVDFEVHCSDWVVK